ncbi:MAG: PAS domain-containing protein [Undibacterium sp.]|nr:PAS domain-containing protein [Opitutaceae bacterium]
MLLSKKIPRIAGWLGLVAAAIGFTILVGWLTGRDLLAFVRMEPRPVRANAAVCLLSVGLALWNHARGGPRWFVYGCAALTLSLCGLTLAEYAFETDLRIDELFARDPTVPHPGRMRPPSCAALILIATALLCATGRPGRNRRFLVLWLSTLVVALSLASIFLQLFSTATAGQLAQTLRFGSHLAFGLLLIGLGLLALRTDGLFLGRLLAPTPSGVLARRLFFGVAVAPALLSLILAVALRTRLVGLVDGVGLFTVALIISGISIALLSLDAATDLDDSREQAERTRLHLTARLQEQAAQLQDTVGTRTRELREVNVSLRAAAEEQRRAQERLESANQRLQLAAQTAALGVWEWDAQTDRSSWDAGMIEIYGLAKTGFHGTHAEWGSRLHPADAEGALRAVALVRAGADSFEHTFRIIRPDGAVRTLYSRAIVQRDASGQLLRCIGTERDITAEREANQHLLELNERFKLALRSSHFGVWETDLATGHLHWDDRMLEIYGLNRADFDGTRTTWKQLIHPEDRLPALLKTERAFNDQDSFHDNEFRIIRPDGTVRHIEAHGQLLRDAAGKPLRLVGLNRDISLERKTEAALHLVEERWQLALEGNNDGVWDWDIATGHFFYDTRYSVMLGFALGELPAHYAGHFRLMHPDDREEFETENQAHLDGHRPFFQHEHRMQSKSGDWVWILDRAKVVSRAPDGRALRMVGTHTDITARKHLEQRLREAEELSQQVGQLAQIGGWELKLTSGELTFTEGARRIHDLAGAEQPTLDQALAFFPIEARETLKAALYSRTPAAPAFDFELPFMSAKGRALWVRVIGRAEFRESRAVALRGALQDITSRHDSEGARRELEGQLFQAQKMETLGTLAGGIAHDFNNLLTGIIGYHELAADTIPEDHPARACLNEARGASMRARDLVEQILTFSRQSAGEEHEAVDLTLVLKEAGRFLRATLAANVIIETDIPDDAGRGLANTTQIYQVVLNLGSNAAHAMRPNGGTLRISLRTADVGADRPGALSSAAPGRYLRLDVSDTGHGMNEATLRRIFDPFFTTKNSREGTGLGLAVVHGIIRAHRGVIDVESTPGVGTTFSIYLPVAEQTAAPAPGDQVRAPAGQGQVVYVVDDEELVGRFIKLALVGIGYEVQAFASAESCLETFNQPDSRCDLLLTDQTMPGQQGTELAAVMQVRLPNLPIIIMSGYFSKVPTQSLGELRNAHLLAKPFTTDELAHALNRAWQLATIQPDGGA